jgi:hypothetical protein
MSAPPDASADDVPDESIALGTRVRLRRLTSAPDLNGRAGVVTQWVPAKDRWEVVLFPAPV